MWCFIIYVLWLNTFFELLNIIYIIKYCRRGNAINYVCVRIFIHLHYIVVLYQFKTIVQ